MSDFLSNIDKLKKEIDINNSLFSNDKVAFSTQRAILESLLDTIPIAINAFKESPRQSNANALAQLITKVTDLFSEIRQTQDLSNQSEYLINEVISPLLKHLINNLYDNMFLVKTKIKEVDLTPADRNILNEALDNYLKDISTAMTKVQNEAEEKIKKFILEV